MKLSGSQEIAADRATVWAALNDPAVLKACIPGCDSLEKTSDTSFEAVATQKIGPVKATFRGAVELSNIKPEESYTISGEGQGGAAGFAKGGADVALTDNGAGGTTLSYDVTAEVGGKLAQLGSRLVQPFAKKLAEQFFDRFRQAVEGPGEGGEDAPTEVAETNEGEKKSLWKRITG